MFHFPFVSQPRAALAVLGVLIAGGMLASTPVQRASAADPADLAVTTLTDTGSGSLRSAVQAANADAAADEIVLGAGTYLLFMDGAGENVAATGDLDVLQPLTIRGAGADQTVIDASALGDRALHAQGAGRLTLVDLTIVNAQTLTSGGAVLNATDTVLTVTDSAFRNNRAGTNGGAISSIGPFAISGSVFDHNESLGAYGAAIHFDVPGAGTFGTIEGSAIIDNVAHNVGGAIAGQGMHLTIRNSTISGNRAQSGSALWNLGGAIGTRSWYLDHVTLAYNFSTVDSGAVHAAGNALFTLKDSIIALNTGGACNADASGAGLNLITASTCGGDDNHFITLYGDPGLRPLATAGQLAPTHRLEFTSPALNKTTCVDGEVDQRGVPRPTAAGACDIGAYERRLVAMPDFGFIAAGQVAVNVNLVANDLGYDPDGVNDLFAGGSFGIVAQPAHGTVTLGAGDAAYQLADADFSGLDTFVYEVCLAGECSTAEVSIEVLGESAASQFEPLPPVRILDTRDAGEKPAPGSTTTLQVLGQGGIPATDVTAVVLNITATQPDAPGYVTVSPTGQPRPVVSSLNVEFSGQSIPNLVTVPVGADGSIDLFTDGGTHLITDVAGYYRPVTDARGGRFQALQPQRILDTRTDGSALPAGGTRDLTVTGVGGVPTEASAVVLNVTATRSAAAGYVTVWPGGTAQPDASNLNMSRADQTIANLVIVPVGANGTVSFFSDNGTDLVVDVTGWFTSDSGPIGGDGLFMPVTPRRLLDTRPDNALGADSSVVVSAVDPGVYATAAVLNVTATQSARGGYLTVWPAGNERPLSSNLNVERADQTIPNAAIVGVSPTGEVAIYSDGGTHLAVDLAGYYVTLV